MTTGGEPIRVLLVDDQELVRYGFRLVLEAEDDIRIVGEASDGAEAVAAAAALRPDVVLMDVRMPGMSGIEATQLITDTVPAARVLVLTTYDRDEFAFGALRQQFQIGEFEAFQHDDLRPRQQCGVQLE